MPRLTYSTTESHALLTAADAAAAAEPDLADLYRDLATAGLDLDACTPDEEVREQLGMPPLEGLEVPAGTAGPGGRGKHDGGDHPRVA